MDHCCIQHANGTRMGHARHAWQGVAHGSMEHSACPAHPPSPLPHFLALIRSRLRFVTVCVAVGAPPLPGLLVVCHIHPKAGTSTSSLRSPEGKPPPLSLSDDDDTGLKTDACKVGRCGTRRELVKRLGLMETAALFELMLLRSSPATKERTMPVWHAIAGVLCYAARECPRSVRSATVWTQGALSRHPAFWRQVQIITIFCCLC